MKLQERTLTVRYQAYPAHDQQARRVISQSIHAVRNELDNEKGRVLYDKLYQDASGGVRSFLQ